MTCFSIQKISLFSLVLACTGLLVSPFAQSQDMRNPDGSKMTPGQIKELRRVDAPIVIELFTAADCSACVLADRMLYDAAKDKNVIALSCQVKDLKESLVDGIAEEQGDDATAQTDGPIDPCVFRQWTYKSINQDSTINIPQFTLNGESDIKVNDMVTLPDRINDYHYAPLNNTLEVLGQWKDKDTVLINLPEAIKGPRKTASVWIVRYKDMEVEKISLGVNKGKVLRFSNIVQDIRHVGKWRGEMRTIEVDVPKAPGGKDRGGYIFLVQEVMGGPMLAAGKLEDYPMPNDLKRSADPRRNEPVPVERPDAPATP